MESKRHSLTNEERKYVWYWVSLRMNIVRGVEGCEY